MSTFVRTKAGVIGTSEQSLKSIVKEADKLIELVEIGDIVNGHEIVNKYQEGDETEPTTLVLYATKEGEVPITDEEIKSVLCKEKVKSYTFQINAKQIEEAELIPIDWLIEYEARNGQEVRLQEAVAEWRKENV